MEEVRIYHSAWRVLLYVIPIFAFGGLYIYIGNLGYIDLRGIICYIAGLFFVLMGLYDIFVLLDERLRRRPYMTITDQGIVFYSGKVVNFADVSKFYVIKKDSWYSWKASYERSVTTVGFTYKPQIERERWEKQRWYGKYQLIDYFNFLKERLFSQLKLGSTRTDIRGQEMIGCFLTSMKAQQLCDLLNERRWKAKQKNKKKSP